MDEAAGGLPVKRLMAAFLLAMAVFSVGTLIAELFGEVPPDIDAKPFGLIYLLLAVAPFGAATVAVSLGAAVGEGFLDISEGVEPDDPFGFMGYVVAFCLFAWLVHHVAPSPADRRWQLAAATLAGAVQALFEAAGLLFLGGSDFVTVGLTLLGNTVAHGLVFGGFVVVLTYPFVVDAVDGQWLPD